MPAWFSLRKLVPASALAAAVIALLIFVNKPPAVQPERDATPEVVAKIDAQDYEVVADLDELLASDENNLWEDDDTSSL